MEPVAELLQVPKFTQPPPDNNEPGAIMILSPYKESIARYHAALAELSIPGLSELSIPGLSELDLRAGVRALTVEAAQGQEADVVLLDTAGDYPSLHIDGSKRLCSGITRARQAEVIIVHEEVATHKSIDAGNWSLRKIWDMCVEGEEGAVVFNIMWN
ncbi:hypothetical protein B0H67DRAFT_638566 [Lasiosphaeris hirsuta]|uniref:Uncharacterized protein n=1 Tax=Lasiosphaeris hirsuta TaxID=260670 RepID=A0AA40B9C0_9PEZI|nr:hypothetical protein B0H67DRAFT_638566 [Lasiosphaeris hirsuta]